MSSPASSVDISYADVVHLLHCILDLDLVGVLVNNEAVTVELLAHGRHFLGNDWLYNDTHGFSLFIPFSEDILYAVNEDQRPGVHDDVSVDLVNSDNLNLGKVA